MSTLEYVKKTSSVKPIFDIHGVRFYLKSPLPQNINPEELKKNIFSKLPGGLFKDINNIFIGDFEYLKNRGATAISYQNSIFLTDAQDNIEDLVNDIAHELGHSLEKKFFHNIHKNNDLKREFLSKKKLAISILKSMGFGFSPEHTCSPEYDKEIDDLLTNKIGLHNIEKEFANLVTTPYSLVSLSEYFSEGLECFLLYDRFSLAKMCPVLYNVIDTIVESE